VYRVFTAGTNEVTLLVFDQALQTNTASTTLACLKNAPPVAEAGPDRLGTETNCTQGVWFFTFDAVGSTDDHGIYTYEWDWDYDGTFEPSGDTDSRVQHGFSVSRLGTNTIALRVTDHVMQTHIDSCQVVLTMGQPPVAETGPDRTVETGWPLDFDGTGSSDDVGVSRYVWDFGDGTTGAGPRPRHIYRSASPTNCSLAGSQFSFRPSRMLITPRWHRLAERCPTCAGQIGGFRVLTQSMKLTMWSLLT